MNNVFNLRLKTDLDLSEASYACVKAPFLSIITRTQGRRPHTLVETLNCLAAQSATGYWNLVDYVHAHATDMGGEEKSLSKANTALDGLTREEGKRQKVDSVALDACIAKQDSTAVKASIDQATALGVDSTPALFINGEKLEGAIRDALNAAGSCDLRPQSAGRQ